MAISRLRKNNMFINSSGGEYQFTLNDRLVSYIFPQDALLDIDGVKLPIGGLNVESYGGKFDGVTIKHFNQMSASIPSKRANFYNSAIVLDENEVGDGGYPTEEDFKVNNMPYLTRKEFYKLQDEVFKGHKPDTLQRKLAIFFCNWTENNRNKVRKQFAEILNDNDQYPKNISVVYNDREKSHCTHLVLTFKSKTECSLMIDNTHPVGAVLVGIGIIPQRLLLEKGVDLFSCKEVVESDKSNYISFFKDNDSTEPLLKQELPYPVGAIMMGVMYNEMFEVLKALPLPIKGVHINYATYNQKQTEECVPLSFQNKIDFAFNSKPQLEEAPLVLAARMRAEHLILSYLFLKNVMIPHVSKSDADDFGFSYSDAEWYPNLNEVGKKLDDIILNLPRQDLEKLYLSYQIDGCMQLSSKFKPIILDRLRLSCVNDCNYLPLPFPGTSVQQKMDIEKQLMPFVYIHPTQHTLFLSKKYLENHSTFHIEHFAIDGPVSRSGYKSS